MKNVEKNVKKCKIQDRRKSNGNRQVLSNRHGRNTLHFAYLHRYNGGSGFSEAQVLSFQEEKGIYGTFKRGYC